STFYAALFALVGVVTPFFPVWLAARGLDAQEIGILLGLPVALRMIAVPLVTRLADHRGAVRQALILACWGTALGYGAVALSAGFAVLLATVTLMSLAYAPVMALADAYAIQRLKESGRAYGPVRLWGSLTFMAANVGAGLMLDVLP